MKKVFLLSLLILLSLSYTQSLIEEDADLKNYPKDVSSERKILDAVENASPETQFKVFHALFKKDKEYSLNSKEGLLRFNVFKRNLQKFKEFNEWDFGYQLGVTPFTDLTNEEYRKKYLFSRQSISEEAYPESDKKFDNLTENDKATVNVDWTKYYGSIKNQGNCGSCWAFSVSGSFEGIRNKVKSSKEPLSAQNLMDCDTGSDGCGGGMFPSPFKYLKNKGITSDSQYPYKARQGSCHKPKWTSMIDGWYTCSSYGKTNPCNESKFASFLSNGPASVGVDAGSYSFQHYKTGIWSYSNCHDDNHAIIAVGYDNRDSNNKIVKIRNSWGSSWGESGYMRIKQNDKNRHTCYTMNEVWVPKYSGN